MRTSNHLLQNIHFLSRLLDEIVCEQEGEGLLFKIKESLALAQKIRQKQDPLLIKSQQRLIRCLSLDQAYKLARALTIYFQMVNMAEEQERIRRLREYERSPEVFQEMSLGKLFKDLKEKGYSPQQILAFFKQCDITPVLTAHPTESKRRTVSDHLFFISSQLTQLNRPDLTLIEKDSLTQKIKEALEVLWQTPEVRDRKVEVLGEVDQTLYLFERTIIDLLADTHEAIHQELGKLGLAFEDDIEPFIHFGSWVGADRDGNPNVTPAITMTTAKKHRKLIINFYLLFIEKFINKFSQSTAFAGVSRELLESLKQDKKIFPQGIADENRYKGAEIYRQKFSFIRRRLEEVLTDKKGKYKDADEFISDLLIVQRSLKKNKGIRASDGDLRRLIVQAKGFRFFLARLDLRDHAQKIRKTIEELLGPQDLDIKVLLNKITDKPDDRKVSSPEARDVLAQFKTFRQLNETFGADMVDSYVLSMSQNPVDILGLLYLAKNEGLIHVAHKRVLKADIGFVPLFETIQTLKDCHEMMDELFAIPLYRSYLKARGDIQEILLGYSDSGKDGGYLAANWHIYLAQQNLCKVAGKYGVKIKFFHGKGGSIDRGSGESHRAILGQPFSAAGGRIKLTEQGEIAAQKYVDPQIARRNMEQLITAVVWTNLVTDRGALKNPKLDEWESVVARLSQDSYIYYRQLVFETPSFLDFYDQATPINTLKVTRIASRPAVRNASRSFDQLRAVPWVLSWMQSRYIISGWYGTGYAFKKYMDDDPRGLEVLRRMYRQWPFFNSIIQHLQISLAKSDLYIARLYSGLVSNEDLRNDIHGAIEREWHLAVKSVLLISQQKELLDDHKVLKDSIKRRNPYLDPLNYIQVRFLQEKSRLGHSFANEIRHSEINKILLLTVNGIASGMKSTG